MKVYVVTSGEYSDYSIEKIFLDREKAEEFAKWVPYANGVDEYETADDTEYEKYYRIQASYVDGDKVRFQIERYNGRPVRESFVSYSDYGKKCELSLIRFVTEANWDAEKWMNKLTKACYDYMAQVNCMLLEGATEKEINMVLSQKEIDE